MNPKFGFHDKLDRRMAEAGTLVCVGLDPQVRHLPREVTPDRPGITSFLTNMIEATAPYTAVYKPNLAFYTAIGLDGLHILADVCAAIPTDIPVLLDCKVGDVGDTARAYAASWFDILGVDACTVNPYLGEDTLAPFFAYEGKGVIVICKTSNSGSGELQDQMLATGNTVYQKVADRCAEWNAAYPASIGLVVGATYPEQLADVRQRVGNLPILLPGVGVQGGDVEASVAAGLDSKGRGLMCSASRSILYASSGEDYAERGAEAALTLRDQINTSRAALQLASQDL
ncbi:MAG TPA: orotidine-5'-phosphate decarboxylase [Thermomicrobiales bacterium]|nr:orotidine-5'-phosphate decarboxylase [Thermomicrobiales bacterium]